VTDTDYPRKPLTVILAVVLLLLALSVDLVSWFVALHDQPREGQVEGLLVVAALMAVVAYLLWRVVGRARWAPTVLSILLVSLELPNILDLVTGGIDQPVNDGDLVLEAAEAVLSLIGVALLWMPSSRNWFFRRSGRLKASVQGTEK